MLSNREGVNDGFYLKVGIILVLYNKNVIWYIRSMTVQASPLSECYTEYCIVVKAHSNPLLVQQLAVSPQKSGREG